MTDPTRPQTPMRMLGMDCSKINFCCGPCVSKVEENPDRPFLKPNNGGRYTRFTWTTAQGITLDLRRVRMCRPCCHRYLEMSDGVQEHDFESLEVMHRDAQAIMQKFDIKW